MTENLPYDPTHPVYDLGEFVLVPARGNFLVKNGKVLEAVEVSLFDVDEECMNWSVWTQRDEEDN